MMSGLFPLRIDELRGRSQRTPGHRGREHDRCIRRYIRHERIDDGLKMSGMLHGDVKNVRLCAGHAVAFQDLRDFRHKRRESAQLLACDTNLNKARMSKPISSGQT
jgi:hypothetical protein